MTGAFAARILAGFAAVYFAVRATNNVHTASQPFGAAYFPALLALMFASVAAWASLNSRQRQVLVVVSAVALCIGSAFLLLISVIESDVTYLKAGLLSLFVTAFVSFYALIAKARAARNWTGRQEDDEPPCATS